MKILNLGENEKKELNNLYHPTATLELESYDFVKISDCLDRQTARFLAILLKETFALIKKGGQIKIYYNPSVSGIEPEALEATLWWLFQRKYSIINHALKKSICRLTIKKETSILKEEDNVGRWTFGMVTNGARPDFIEKSIQSIRNLKIPFYEIIICGYYPKVKGGDIKYIEFRERDDKGWITKKKNLIAKSATYTNLCIFHDRMVFQPNWYKGMKQYGNSFEVLSCVQKMENGERAGDWISANVPLEDPGLVYRIEELDYRDWDRYIFISGQMMIIKKHVWEDEPWNETLYWKEAEDIEYSYRLAERGFLPRFNPFSTCLSLSWGHGRLPKRVYPQRPMSILYNMTDVPIRRVCRFLLYLETKLPWGRKLISSFYQSLTGNMMFKFIRSH